MIVFLTPEDLARNFGSDPGAIERQKKELRRRLMDTEAVQWAGKLTFSEIKWMRKGGDPELQMLALLCAVQEHGVVVTESWAVEKLTDEQKQARFHALNILAKDILDAKTRATEGD